MFAPVTRLVIYAKDAEKLAAFYQRIFELPVVSTEPGWIELGAGGCNLAFHKAARTADHRRSAAKISFGVKDVMAAKAQLEKRGLKFGPIHFTPNSDFCNGKDPEGNHLSIGNRGLK